MLDNETVKGIRLAVQDEVTRQVKSLREVATAKNRTSGPDVALMLSVTVPWVVGIAACRGDIVDVLLAVFIPPFAWVRAAAWVMGLPPMLT